MSINCCTTFGDSDFAEHRAFLSENKISHLFPVKAVLLCVHYTAWQSSEQDWQNMTPTVEKLTNSAHTQNQENRSC